ncbi:hypothetical protein J6590_097891 [Homalodisca vitripennis]|nr:hypothetical protein J6590_097891 [Homalodisca vitripennis]
MFKRSGGFLRHTPLRCLPDEKSRVSQIEEMVINFHKKFVRQETGSIGFKLAKLRAGIITCSRDESCRTERVLGSLFLVEVIPLSSELTAILLCREFKSWPLQA